ncbi:MAG: hypothetical protein HY785_13140 [Oscillatoriophycideae cyanobacterium NC_groundwater_1537_Pr4_S-0.65um_50_18]|nr:hypothetical protein [Oscillatoriophycideae cyanobacterium NC_groundwater_1537_Pr4_S-0.65um_50_18]
MIPLRTIKYGDAEVPVIERFWKVAERLPYRKTYSLKPGQHWKDAGVTSKQWESYVLLDDGEAIPVGAAIARELLAEGASFAVFTELWGGLVLVDSDLVCVREEGQIQELLDILRTDNGGNLGGLPDAIAIFPDGRIAMREAKNIATKDRLSRKQHDFASIAQRLLGDRLNLTVVEWGRSLKSD